MKKMIKLALIVIGLSIMLATYIDTVINIWIAFFYDFKILIDFNSVNEGILELIILTFSIVPIMFCIIDFAKRYVD